MNVTSEIPVVMGVLVGKPVCINHPVHRIVCHRSVGLIRPRLADDIIRRIVLPARRLIERIS